MLRTTKNLLYAGADMKSAVILALYVAMTGNAAAQTFGEVAKTVTGQFTSFGALLGAVASLLGLGFTLLSIAKFKGYSANPQDPNNKLTTAVGMMAAGVALIALPAFMGVGVASFFGDSATTGTLTGTQLGPLSGGS